MQVTTAPNGAVTSVQPSTDVVSLVSPGGARPIRPSFCNQVYYFASAEHARPWLKTRAGGEVLEIEAAYRAGSRPPPCS